MLPVPHDSLTRGHRVREFVCTYRTLRDDQGQTVRLPTLALSDPRIAKVVEDTLHYGENERKWYSLYAYVIMPNHVHAVVRPLLEKPLERILQSWKGYTGREINLQFRRSGTLWQEESFDRIIRDEDHLWQAIQYIGANPRKAGLTCNQCPTWLRAEWAKLGWKFE